LTVHNISAANKTGTNPAEIVGYMPKRGDFEVEYDNDAELLLA
jgi:transcriptional adapter 2-alpha